MRLKTNLFDVEVTKWEDGTGTNVLHVLCLNANEAVIVKEALRKLYPDSLNVSSGKEVLKCNFVIEIGQVFSHDIKNFVEDD